MLGTTTTLLFYLINFAIVGSVMIQQKERQSITFSEQVSKSALEFSNIEKITVFLISLIFILLILNLINEF
jgi:preprotein translocase subunit SecG